VNEQTHRAEGRLVRYRSAAKVQTEAGVPKSMSSDVVIEVEANDPGRHLVKVAGAWVDAETLPVGVDIADVTVEVTVVLRWPDQPSLR